MRKENIQKINQEVSEIAHKLEKDKKAQLIFPKIEQYQFIDGLFKFMHDILVHYAAIIKIRIIAADGDKGRDHSSYYNNLSECIADADEQKFDSIILWQSLYYDDREMRKYARAIKRVKEMAAEVDKFRRIFYTLKQWPQELKPLADGLEDRNLDQYITKIEKCYETYKQYFDSLSLQQQQNAQDISALITSLHRRRIELNNKATEFAIQQAVKRNEPEITKYLLEAETYIAHAQLNSAKLKLHSAHLMVSISRPDMLQNKTYTLQNFVDAIKSIDNAIKSFEQRCKQEAKEQAASIFKQIDSTKSRDWVISRKDRFNIQEKITTALSANWVNFDLRPAIEFAHLFYSIVEVAVASLEEANFWQRFYWGEGHTHHFGKSEQLYIKITNMIKEYKATSEHPILVKLPFDLHQEAKAPSAPLFLPSNSLNYANSIPMAEVVAEIPEQAGVNKDGATALRLLNT